MISKYSIHWLPDVQVEYEFKKGSSYRVMPNHIQPPTPPEITKLKITVSRDKHAVDLTEVLPNEIINEIMDAIIVEIVNATINKDEYDEAFCEVSNE